MADISSLLTRPGATHPNRAAVVAPAGANPPPTGQYPWEHSLVEPEPLPPDPLPRTSAALPKPEFASLSLLVATVVSAGGWLCIIKLAMLLF